MTDLIIIGGGGHTKSCIDVIELEGKYTIIGILDHISRLGQTVLGYPIVGSDEDIDMFLPKCNHYLIGVGQVLSSEIRRKIVQKFDEYNIEFPTIISPLAYVSKHSNLGKGNIIMHNAVINSASDIGNFNIINSNSVIEHDCLVGNFNHISVSSTVCGTVKIGNDCFIGAGATVNNNINIGESIFVGSNSLVNKTLLEKGMYSGNPVRRIR